MVRIHPCPPASLRTLGPPRLEWCRPEHFSRACHCVLGCEPGLPSEAALKAGSAAIEKAKAVGGKAKSLSLATSLSESLDFNFGRSFGNSSNSSTISAPGATESLAIAALARGPSRRGAGCGRYEADRAGRPRSPERIGATDLCVTSDIPLASRCLKKGARIVSPTGKQWTEANIGNALAGRDIARHCGSWERTLVGQPR